MRLGLDFDGVICDGRYLTQPDRAIETYAQLPLLDDWTRYTYNSICRYHQAYIITSRSFDGATQATKDYLDVHGMIQPCGIITNIEQRNKPLLVEALDLTYHIDDSPVVFKGLQNPYPSPKGYLMDNPGWDENQSVITKSRLYTWKDIYNLIFNATVNA